MTVAAVNEVAGPPGLVDGDGLVCSSLRCHSCGYDLQRLQATGRCPECGAEVERSLGRIDSARLRRFARGFRLASTGLAIGVPMPLLAGTFLIFIPAGFIAGLILNVTALLLLAAGAWALSAPWHPVHDRGFGLMRGVAVSLVILAIAEGVVIWMLPRWWPMLLISQGGPVGPLMFVALPALLVRLRGFAMANGQPALARHAKYVAICFVICWISVVLAFIVPGFVLLLIPGEVLLGLWALHLMMSFNRRAARALRRSC